MSKKTLPFCGDSTLPPGTGIDNSDLPSGTLRRTLPGRLQNQKCHPCGTPCKRRSTRTLSGTRILGSQIRGLWDPHLAQWTQMSPPTLPGRFRDPSGTLTKFRFVKAIRDASLTLIGRRKNDHYRTLITGPFRDDSGSTEKSLLEKQ